MERCKRRKIEVEANGPFRCRDIVLLITQWLTAQDLASFWKTCKWTYSLKSVLKQRHMKLSASMRLPLVKSHFPIMYKLDVTAFTKREYDGLLVIPILMIDLDVENAKPILQINQNILDQIEFKGSQEEFANTASRFMFVDMFNTRIAVPWNGRATMLNSLHALIEFVFDNRFV